MTYNKTKNNNKLYYENSTFSFPYHHTHLDLLIFHNTLDSVQNEELDLNRTMFEVFSVNFEKVSIPLCLMIFFQIVLLVKIIIQNFRKQAINNEESWMNGFYKIFTGIPESCLLIILGIIIGLILPHKDTDSTAVELVDILLRVGFLGSFDFMVHLAD